MKVSVTELAHFIHRRGDIHFRYDRHVEPADGIRAQKALQRTRPEGYLREVALSLELEGEPNITVRGRADGVDESRLIPVIEEIKATRTDLDALHAHASSVHWAQGMLYAYLYAVGCGCKRVCVRLVYLHLDTKEERVHERTVEVESLEGFFRDTVRQYREWISKEAQRRCARDAGLAQLDFPEAAFRVGQRRLAEAVYRAIHVGGTLLAEAPTGIGKTLGTLYPAVKALGRDQARRIFFLTAKATGAAAASKAIATLRDAGAPLRSVVLTAKAEICFNPELRCDPEECIYARGFYDRVRPALTTLLERDDLSREAVVEVARLHSVCPFELSLHAALWSDVIIGDLNYVFDPIVRVTRLADLSGATLLIDEAHHFPERGREMFSAELDATLVDRALGEAKGSVARALAEISKALRTLLSDRDEGISESPSVGAASAANASPCELRDSRLPLPQQRAESPHEALLGSHELTEVPTSLCASITRFNQLLDEEAAEGSLLELGRMTWRFERCLEWFVPGQFTFLVRRDEMQVRVHCVDPAPLLGPRLREAGSSILFSATLAPFEYFRAELDIGDAPSMRLASPFPPENLGTLVVTDISTRWRERAASLDCVVALIGEVAMAKAGNYLVFFPSYAYLSAAQQGLAKRFPALEVDAQDRGMSRSEQVRFLDRFTPGRKEPRVALAVMAGSFGESIDLVGERLIGVIVIGVGLPPRSLERDVLQWHYRAANGYDFAYRYPGFVRVLQSAGRLIRSEADRGILVLVDSRYRWSKYRQLLPDHWQVNEVRSEAVGRAVSEFWNHS